MIERRSPERDVLPIGNSLQRSPLSLYVRAALTEIGFLYRATKQWEAWEHAKRTPMAHDNSGDVTIPRQLLTSGEVSQHG